MADLGLQSRPGACGKSQRRLHLGTTNWRGTHRVCGRTHCSYGGGSVEDQLWDLTTLHSSAVGALRRALELECHVAHEHLRHALLAEETEFIAVEDYGGGVIALRLDLNRIFEEHVERVARSVREELGVVLGKRATQAL